MRTLKRNEVKLWYVAPTSKVEQTDSNGHYTGEFVSTFGTPVVVYLPLYPFGGQIARAMFGKDASLDMVSVSNNVELAKDGLLFLTQPTANYATTYTYKVDVINKSLNTFSYGLTRNPNA